VHFSYDHAAPAATCQQPPQYIVVRPVHLLLASVLAVAAVGIGAVLGSFVLWGDAYGTASELYVSGRPSNVVQLSVNYHGRFGVLPDDTPGIESAHPGVELSGDQVRSQSTGWTAACMTWGQLHVLGPDQVDVCALGTTPPEVWYHGTTTGTSADLAHALAFAHEQFGLLGDLRVATTGQLVTQMGANDDGTVTATVEVHPIAGVPQKAAAAAVADVDVLVVPSGNAEEFAAQASLQRSDVELLAVDTLDEAFIALGLRASSQVVTSRFAQTPPR